MDLQVAVPSLCFVRFEFSLWILDLAYLYFAKIFIQMMQYIFGAYMILALFANIYSGVCKSDA